MVNPKQQPFPLWPWCLLGLLILSGGALSRWEETLATEPLPCAYPATEHDILRCDGKGQPLVHQAWLVGQPLELNHASKQDLEALPKIGPSLARAILAHRELRGGFRSLEELRDVPGIGPKIYLRIRPYLRVGSERLFHRP